MKEFLTSPYLWLSITGGTFVLGRFINKKMKNHLYSPLLISVIITALCLFLTKTDYTSYKNATAISQAFLGPATVCLAFPIYLKFDVLKKNFIQIISATFVGSITALVSVYALCKLFGFDDVLTNSLLPKSITSAIAIDVSTALGGIPSITMVSLMIAGLTGAVTLPAFLKLFKVNDKVTTGLAIGTASHALGTTRAIELGETESAMSGLALAFTGIITVFLTLFF